MKNEAVSPAKRVAIQEVSLDSLLKEMSEWSDRIAKRAYELFAASGFSNGHDREDWLKAEQELLTPVALEVTDGKDEFVVKAEVPGFEAKDLDIHLNGSHLVIEGKRETSKKKKEKDTDSSYTESESQHIYRMIELPAAVLADKTRAELKNSVLELRLPKAEKPKQIAPAAA
jgi:HSP20 family protein